MTKSEAVKAVEGEFDAMTSRQRKALWVAIDQVAEAEYERGVRAGLERAKRESGNKPS